MSGPSLFCQPLYMRYSLELCEMNDLQLNKRHKIHFDPLQTIQI